MEEVKKTTAKVVAKAAEEKKPEVKAAAPVKEVEAKKAEVKKAAPAAKAEKKAPAKKAPAKKTAEKKAAAPAASAGSVKVTAGAAGKVFKVEASVGQAVKAGDPVIILEAMKMEIPVVAPQDGTVASIDVAEGASVENGDTLATMN